MQIQGTFEFWNQILRKDETWINLCQTDGKGKVWRTNGPHHVSNMVEAALLHGPARLVFIDDVTADRESKFNSEAYRAMIPAII